MGGLMMALGSWILFTAIKLGYMSGQKPGPGFLPLWTGLGIIFFGLAIGITSLAGGGKKFKKVFVKKELINMASMTGCVLLVFALTPVLGLLVPLGVTSGIMSRVMGTRSWKKVMGLALLVPVAMFLIFGIGLKARLPLGIFGG